MDIYKPQDKHDIDRFGKEMLFFSYIAHKVAEHENVNEYSITKLTKIAANYVQDWEEVLGRLGNYIPYMGLAPNPYGMVAAIPRPIAGRPLFIYELQSVAKKEGFWYVREDGSYKHAVMLSNSTSLEERLLRIDKVTGFYPGFDPHQIETASFLSEIYSKFNTLELNILASHRDKTKSKRCLEYAFRVWETNYQELIPKLIFPAEALASDVRDKILKMAVSCEQIELKTGYAFDGIQEVTDKLERISDQFDGLERSLIQKIVYKIRKKSEFDIGVASFNEQYLLNREYIHPLTTALIYVFNMYFHGDSISEDEKQIKRMRKAFKRSCIIEANCNPVEISCSEDFVQILQNVERFHKEAEKRGEILLMPFRRSDENSPPGKRRDEFVDWVVTDGRDDGDAY
jgi:hypothetical protein